MQRRLAEPARQLLPIHGFCCICASCTSMLVSSCGCPNSFLTSLSPWKLLLGNCIRHRLKAPTGDKYQQLTNHGPAHFFSSKYPVPIRNNYLNLWLSLLSAQNRIEPVWLPVYKVHFSVSGGCSRVEWDPSAAPYRFSVRARFVSAKPAPAGWRSHRYSLGCGEIGLLFYW